MPDELEYIVNGALTHCNLGSGFMPLNATSNTSVHIQRQLVATALDRLSLVNIPSYGMCSKSCAPCSPVPVGWVDTYEYVKVKGNRPLIFKSSCMCTLGGKIEFITSGQVPLDQALTAESLQSINEANEQSNEAVEEYEAEKDAVGESGIAEGFIPVWGSGRDAVNSFQTGHWGWGIFHSAMVVVDVCTLGTGSIVKGGVKGLIKGGVKVAAKETGEAITKALTKKALAALAAKEAAVALFKKGAGHIAEASIKYLGVCIAKACFAPGTRIAVQNGYKPIEDLQSGDEVWAYNEDTGETALKPVLNVFEREADTLVALTIDGEVIHTTPEHPFFADGSWKAAGLLQRGDTIQLRNGKAAVVQNVCYKFDEALAQAYGDDTINSELFSPLTKVFNLEVEDWHTYFVGNNEALVHNTVCVKEIAEAIAKKWEDLARMVHCFIAGTKVKTQKGDVPIEQIKEEDEVFAYDFSKQEIVVRKVPLISKSTTEKTIAIYFKDEVIQCTRRHRIWINEQNDWIEAGDLEINMNVLGIDGKEYAIYKIEEIEKAVETYNFEVDLEHNYFVGDIGILVHNGPGPKYPKSVFNDPTLRDTKIYRYFDPATNETYYVGKTVQGIEKRASQHAVEKGLQELTRENKLAYEIIEKGNWTTFQTAAREQHFIMKLNSRLQKGMPIWNKINALSKAKFDYFSKLIKCP